MLLGECPPKVGKTRKLLLELVARPGIEPGTQGFSVLLVNFLRTSELF